MQHLQLLLFGHYQLHLAGGPAKFATDHARALLAYLAVEARPQQRTSLATLLWPDQPEAAARQNLRQALVYLKKALQSVPQLAQVLEINSKTVYLHPQTLTIDVVNFRQLLADSAAHDHATLLTCPACLRRLQAAADLYLGEFLQGFFIKHSPPFEEWALYTREQLHRQAIDALYSLTLAHELLGDYQAMQVMAARQLVLEPWREEAHVQRMRALAHSGQNAAALAHYAVCVRVLEEELGVAPTPATTELYLQIRAGQLQPLHTPAITDAAPPAATAAHVGKQQPISPRAAGLDQTVADVTAKPAHAATPAIYDWATMPVIEQFHGRTAEVEQLRRWLLADRYRVIAVLGMGGLGKTTLAAHVTQAVAPHFAVVIWRSLLNAPPLDDILQSWLRNLAGQSLTALPTATDEQLRLLLTYLRETRCLLVLDNLESIMQSGAAAGEPRPGYTAYTQLWQLLATTSHQSCLLLTSREEPRELDRLANQTQALALLNLAGLDPSAGAKLLQVHGLNTAATTVRTLIDHYSGNPLALQLVANTILDLFDGDINAFQQDGTPIFDDIRTVLNDQFVRLSPLEQELLLWLAIERDAVTLQRLEENLTQRPPKRAFVEALRALQRRSLVEHGNATFTLQNVVTEYLTDYLVEALVDDLAGQLSRTGLPVGAVDPTSEAGLAASLFNCYTLMQADAKESVRQSQTRLILQPVAQRLLQQFGSVGLTLRIKQLLDRLRAAIPQTPGYAAGNLFNLCHELALELHGLNFAQLTVWQADLRGVTAQACDFTGANLARAVFTDNFGLINTVAVSPDGRLLAAATGYGEIRLWYRDDRRPAGAFQGHDSHIWSLAFSPDGHLLASGGDDQCIRIWDLNSLMALGPSTARVILQEHTGGVHTVAFSPDGRTLASAGYDQQIRLWDTASGQLQAQLHGHTGCVYSVTFSPDGQTLVSGSDDQTVRVWDLRRHKQHTAHSANHPVASQILHGHSERVYSVAFSPDGQTIASGSTDQTVCLWDWHGPPVGAQLRRHLVGHHHLVRAVAFSPDGQTVASGSYDETIRLWAVTSGALRQTLYGHSAWIRALAFTPDGQQLVSGSFDYTLRLWDLQQGAEQTHYLLRGYTNLVRAVAFGPDGKTIASGSDDHIVRLWALHHTGTGLVSGRVEEQLRAHTRMIRTLAFSPNGRWLASGGYDYMVCVWDLTKPAVPTEPLRYTVRHDNLVRTVAFSPDSQTLATGSSDRTVCLWDAASGALRHRLTGHTDSVWGVTFSPDGQLVASCSADLTVKLWTLADGELQHSFQAHAHPVKALAFSPDRRLLATGSEDQTIRVWEVATGELCYSCYGHTDFIWSVAFSPDGQTLATSSSDRTIRLWDLRAHPPKAGFPPPLRHLLTGHRDWVWMVAFSPDGQTLASCSDDETVKLWAVETGECRQTLRAPGPYAGMKISGASGLSAAQKAALKALGAIETPDALMGESTAEAKVPTFLPAPLTPIVGRTAELAALTTLLQQGVRLLTLIGPGGMGKTRLALEVGRTMQPQFVDGVYFVALAPLTHAAELAPTIAAALNLPLQGSEPGHLLRQRLQQKQTLLILDNFEQLLPTAQAQATGKVDTAALDLVQALLQHAPQLQILATSRERLNLQGEQIYRVEGLPFPTQATITTAIAETSAACALFLQCARRVRADFRVTSTDLPALLHICRLVQGMPLGLEMTAAWVDQLTLAEIAGEMNKSLDFLTLTEHGVPERQRSLRAVFAWSWQLLSPTEQDSLRCLAIFRGGFTRHAAQTVAGANLPVLSTLSDKSLIQVGEGRYTVHELLRQFAYAQLLATPVTPTRAHTQTNAGDYSEVAKRHSEYYLTFLATRAQRMAHAESRAVTAEIQIEIDNVRQAWGWAACNCDDELLDAAAYTLWQFCKSTGLLAAGVELFQQVIDCLRQALGDGTDEVGPSTDQQKSSMLSKMLALQSSCLISLSQHEKALAVAQQAIAVGKHATPNPQTTVGIALGYLVHGQALRRTGYTAQARPLITRAVELVQAQQQRAGLQEEMLPEIEMRAYGWLCSIALNPDHDYGAAQQFAEANLQLCHRLGKLDGEMIAITDLIDIALATDDLAMARQYSQQVLQMAEQLSHTQLAANSRRILADVARRQGEYLFAYTLAERALIDFQQLGDVLQQVIVLGRLALLSTLMGAYPQAQQWFDQLAPTRRTVESSLVEIYEATVALARFALYQGHYGQTLRHAQQAQSIAQQLAAPANQAQAECLLGHAHAAQRAWPAAAAAYARALAYTNVIGASVLGTESQAGLAQVKLAQGELAEARKDVEAILATLSAHPQASLDEPFLIYLICYRVLRAAADPRAAAVLQSGYNLLQSYAGNITEPRLRHSFLHAVPTHCALQEAYRAAQAKRLSVSAQPT